MNTLNALRFQKSICPNCAFAIPQKENSWSQMGLVDCPKKGHGNAYETKCEHFFENTHLLRLREAAVNAIREFERIADLHHGHTTKAGEQNIDLVRAAARSCAMQEAYAIMLGISYDTAAGLLHKETRKEISNEQV